MTKYIRFLIIMGMSIQGFTQNIERDIFHNLKHESANGSYTSYLEKNIFNDLIFSDNRGNEITLEKKYIAIEYGDVLKNAEAEIAIFKSMIHEHRQDKDYKAKFSVDIFNKIIIEDNRNRKVEIGKDIKGNETYKEENNGVHRSMQTRFNGVIEYKGENKEATLQKDIFNKWIYKDSHGNEFKFSKKTWDKLKNKFGTEENIFNHLIFEFLEL
ncbi:hypothetical protein H0I25_13920 [Cellulophaga sp. HaHa_2_95]|uniref:hypothetical protein n=1 Tax=unclassified Cellulophaga TaxID=2634405 RepID=UPI001C4ED9DD|nr:MULTISPECIES: hypothetical protein [unclassified Cellulophaga]QXP52540.1 hypothetical protein H0I24_01030 [Cellulophaga sp. HaHa_2_1]QXP55169.1 hypothetical protein H0I25_13920 [Cellulophaga sp. HaHa_2_95]